MCNALRVIARFLVTVDRLFDDRCRAFEVRECCGCGASKRLLHPHRGVVVNYLDRRCRWRKPECDNVVGGKAKWQRSARACGVSVSRVGEWSKCARGIGGHNLDWFLLFRSGSEQSPYPHAYLLVARCEGMFCVRMKC